MRPYLENKPKLIYKSAHMSSYDFPSHLHNNVEIAYCFEGTQGIRIGDGEYTLSAGDAAVIFPNVPHEYFKTADVAARSVSLICSTKLVEQMLPEVVTKYPLSPFVSSKQCSDRLALAAEGIYAAEDGGAQMLGWTYIALSELLGAMTLVSQGGDLELPSRVVAYIDENFKEDLSLEHIAKVFGYHPSYIAHVFCDQLKFSFRRYLGAVRAEYAAEQIRTTKKSLTEIAYDSGCNSLNTLCRCFKNHFSMTPTQYKQKIKKKG